jgi:predicted nuclease of predicted toxin-antitoxin system
MNLSPQWCDALAKHGFEAVHWSGVGSPGAEDEEIFAWARANSYVVFTNDMDFGAILASTGEDGPSVLQVRTQRLLPRDAEQFVIDALRQFASALDKGALVVVDESRARARILPL